MHFLKQNRVFIGLVLLVPFLMLYVDEPVMTSIRAFHQGGAAIDMLLRGADKVMYYAAHGTTMIVGAVMLYLYGRHASRRLQDLGASLFIGLATAGITVQIIKHLIGRARPRVTDKLMIIGPSLAGSYDSFPSGHTAMAFCLAAIVSHHYPKYRAVAYAFAVFEGFARIDSTSHFPGDVLGGAILGTLIAAFVNMKTVRPDRAAS